jgi:hypothetical protein
LTPEELIEGARRLVSREIAGTKGLWGRAAATLVRRALEQHVHALLMKHAPGAQAAPMRSQLLCLEAVLSNRGRARELAYTWYRLSAALHHQAYELPPTAGEIHAWIDVVSAHVETPPRRRF